MTREFLLEVIVFVPHTCICSYPTLQTYLLPSSFINKFHLKKKIKKKFCFHVYFSLPNKTLTAKNNNLRPRVVLPDSYVKGNLLKINIYLIVTNLIVHLFI